MTRKDQLDFIARVAPAAQIAAKTFGIPASVTIAQAILESAWGQSAPGNNFFGIKKGNADVPYTERPAIERVNGKAVAEVAKFRSYATPTMCFGDHSKLLSSDERYRRAMNDADNPIVFATRLKQCGYSTDPKYDDKLVALMRDFKLAQFDASPRRGAQ